MNSVWVSERLHAVGQEKVRSTRARRERAPGRSMNGAEASRGPCYDRALSAEDAACTRGTCSESVLRCNEEKHENAKKR